MSSGMAYVVVDLGYGDAGKGTIVDALTRKKDVKLIVRFNGGGQAAHNVVLPDGIHHTFAQFGSGSFVPGVKTYLSSFFRWNPISMMAEAEVLASKGVPDILSRVYVDEQALIVTPWHRAFNRLQEHARGNDRHGSCGEGIGDATGDFKCLSSESYLLAGEIWHRSVEDITNKLERIAFLKRDSWNVMNKTWRSSCDLPHEDFVFLMDPEKPRKCAHLYKRISERVNIVGCQLGLTPHLFDIIRPEDGDIIFEGAQGILIDESYGFAPYQTWSDCTSRNALELLRQAGWAGGTHVIGVTRPYAIRHGAGPFPTEDALMSRSDIFAEVHNIANPWQGAARIGHFDAVATNYAIEADGHIDSLAITNLDRFVDRQWKICTGYSASDGNGPLVFTPAWKQKHEDKATDYMNHVMPYYDGESWSLDVKVLRRRIGELLDRPTSIVSYGPDWMKKLYGLDGLWL